MAMARENLPHSKLSLFRKNVLSYSHQEYHNSLLPKMFNLDASQYLFTAPNSYHFFELKPPPTENG
ncbi:uncharacterized protein LOC106776811 [Vigna radiata var. radiata]|uniref:Uncharacterized protein LOC106776811 n=1 Tax=Vigna radiata var. radiata TaxID=3916 RepID=A0A1S3VN99_VIGRR|nr:uncharacterized protein LOC106776811 [Vigna radiata var. radiata]